MEEEILNEIEKNEAANEIIEIDENEEVLNTQYDIDAIKTEAKPKKKNKKPSKWSNLTKKQKILIIGGIILVLLIIVGIVLYFLVFKKDKPSGKKDEPLVIIEKDNYRYEDGWLVFIDSDKKELGKYECINKDENYCYVAYYSDEDKFDQDKKVYENGDDIQNRSDILLDNYVFVYDSNKKSSPKVVLYNISEGKTEEVYELVKEVNSKKAIVKKDDKYALLSFEETKVNTDIESYDYMGYILDKEYLVVAKNRNYQLIDFEGNKVSKTVPGEIKSFNSNTISAKVNGNYYAYDYEGKVKIDDEYDYIRLVSDYIIAASNKKLTVFDSSGARMNGEDIRISSNDYNTKLIFNDELYQIGKEVAFDAIVNGSNMRLEFDDEVVNINLNEGIFNKTLSYVNYFNGKLYFYKDAEKTSLIGNYACGYANAVDEASEKLENCFLAVESNLFKSKEEVENGYLPIYNGRYVFISDTSRPNANDNIILWDLKALKKLATYKEVDAGFHNAVEDVSAVTTAGTLILAKNTSDSYGLVNITGVGINGVIGFKNANDEDPYTNVSVSVLNDNFLFKRSDNSYHLYDTKGREIASSNNEIVEYINGYIKVKVGDKYVVNGVDGKNKIPESKEIYMEKDYAICIDDNNSLKVYKYDSDVNLAPEDIKIDEGTIVNYGVRGNNILSITYTYNDKVENIEINLG